MMKQVRLARERARVVRFARPNTTAVIDVVGEKAIVAPAAVATAG